MNPNEILLKQQCVAKNESIIFLKGDNEKVVPIKPTNRLIITWQVIINFFREILLPYGYPESVSEDYFDYQLWDTVQAFCSTIIGAFTTRAILKGVGVGDANANAYSATITWILKDGSGMIGRILFAWIKGNDLDTNCKKWRIFADGLNDLAMSIELFLPYFSSYSMQILCFTSTLKSIVGIAGGATRASITNHQAIRDNMAEISAKDGSQETVVNLIASFVSIFLLNHFSSDSFSTWMLICMLVVTHLFANYKAVTSLVFRNFNDQRLALVLKSYFKIGTTLNPVKVNASESVILGFGLNVQKISGFNIVMGINLENQLKQITPANLKQILHIYSDRPYFILPALEERIIYIGFEKNESVDAVLSAYFYATCLAIAICIHNGIELQIFTKRQLYITTPLTRMHTFMKKFEKNLTGPMSLPLNISADIKEHVDQEISMFFTALHINGWSTEKHSLKIGEWRSTWRINKKYN